MTISQALLHLLVCPETRQSVTLADAAFVSTLNAAIKDGTLENRGGVRVVEPLDGALVRQDQRYCYPIRDDIPIMLIEEAIPLPGGTSAAGQG